MGIIHVLTTVLLSIRFIGTWIASQIGSGYANCKKACCTTRKMSRVRSYFNLVNQRKLLVLDLDGTLITTQTTEGEPFTSS